MRHPITMRDIILFSTCLFLAFYLVRGCDTPIDKNKYISKALFDASQDSLHRFRNSFGEEETKTKLLYGTISDLKKLGASKDSSIQRLIKLVNKKTISATILSSSTSSTVSSSTVVAPKDTIQKDSINYVYPEYTLKPQVTRWDSIAGIANKDTFKVFYKVFNEFDLVQRYEKQKVEGKLFKKNVAIVNITNKNPKTETRELKSFAVAPPPQKKGLIFTAGVIAGIILKQLISK